MASNDGVGVPPDAAAGVDVPVRILDLIDQFERIDASELNETTMRETYLNPLLEELGWDPRNRRGAANKDRDVILEDSVVIDGVPKAPDYALVIGGRRRFFVEAKRPSVNISTAKSAAYQVRRYCWSAGLPFGLLTDFEEFAIYDCRAIPKPTDAATVGRIEYFTYKDLPTQWATLDRMFSKRAVQAGALEVMAATTKQPAQARPIDEAFLADIRSWRATLATNIAKNNSGLDVVDVNHAVQVLIDRIIFLRIAEARGLEPAAALRSVVEGDGTLYERLLALFARADDRYNSGLFHLSPNSELPGSVDEISKNLTVDDRPLARIIDRLYYPEPYEFSVLPADILGHVYEQFLGERVTLSADHKAVVEQKPEVRKAGGVYYTPAPIVDYIVQQTVRPLLEGKKPADVTKLRFVDPACGSGSFLITVYQCLLDWHRDYYADKPRLAKSNLEFGSDGFLRVKPQERKQILQKNIFGVDIDPQAVEVTKLSLLLKVIEGQQQMELNVGRILPDLDANITCGNSLVGTDFPMPLFLTAEEELQFNPFDWQDKWPKILDDGGFDAVVGNPPYLSIDSVWGKGDPRLAYIRSAYAPVYADKTDILFYFIKKAADICKGEIGYIVSRSFLEADKAQKLRAWLSDNVRVREILDFQHATVFPKVGINTAIVRLTRSTVPKTTEFRRWSDAALPVGYSAEVLADRERTANIDVPRENLTSKAWNFGNASVEALLAKLDVGGDPVGSILKIGQGMQTGLNTAFGMDLSGRRYSELHAAGLAYQRARNSDIEACWTTPSGVTMIFPDAVGKLRDLPDDVQEHLKRHRSKLKQRAAYERGDCEWWQYTWPRQKESVDRPKILCPYRAATNRFSLDETAEYIGLTDTTVLYESEQPENLRYILGVLNSKIASFRFQFVGKLLGGGVYEYYENTVSQLPIPRRATGDAAHDQVVDLVHRRMEAEADLRSSMIESEQQMIGAVIDTITSEIDALVAQLFGLTDEDLALIEEFHR
jgi:type I restriction-modification system DNA methylase subunit